MASAWGGHANTATEGLRVAGVVLGCTLVLTAVFLGVRSLVTGGTPGVAQRLPYYALVLGLVFAGGVVAFDGEVADPFESLRLAAGLAAGTLVVVALAGEGVAYAVVYSGRLLASQVLFYLVGAGLVGTGFGYWLVRNWRDVLDTRRKARL